MAAQICKYSDPSRYAYSGQSLPSAPHRIDLSMTGSTPYYSAHAISTVMWEEDAISHTQLLDQKDRGPHLATSEYFLWTVVLS
jgi:hypothetical protein